MAIHWSSVAEATEANSTINQPLDLPFPMKIAVLSGMTRRPIFSPRSLERKARAIRELRSVGLVALIGIAAVLPIMIFGIPNGADLPNHLRFALPFYESIQAGHFHPGWLAESNYGLGDPRFIFYPPGLYYLLSALRRLTGEWYSASIATLALLSIAGGLGAYAWARNILSPTLAIWTGIFYALAPYRLNEIYQASLLSEYAACSILPFAFCFLERAMKRRSFYDVFGLGATYSVLILTHLPIAVIGSIALGLYALIRLKRENLIPTLVRLALAVIFGLAASSFFWLSMIAELSWIKGNAAAPNPYYDYRLNFLFSPSALTNRNTWYANILALSVIGFLLPGIVFVARSFRQLRINRAMIAAFGLMVGSFLMATSLSRPLWAIIPKLSEIQFPWRWLSVTSLMGSLVLAASLPFWQAQLRVRIRPRELAIGLVFVLSLIFVGTQIILDSDYLGHSRFEPMTQDVRGAVSFKDWLPKSAKEFNGVEKTSAKAFAGSRPVTVTAWDAERRTFKLDPGPENTLVVQTYFYPRWTAEANNQSLPVSANPDGLIEISVPADATEVQLTFQSPKRVRWSEIVSGASWLLFVGALILFAVKSRKSLESASEVNDAQA
jgi:6-pyruvoyl-tetrahydropterin synthase related domain